MLKIYDKNHNAIGHIVKYKDCKIESEVATGDKTLSFVYLAKHHNLQNEMYVQTKDDEYVIKEVPATTGAFPQIVAMLNLEDLQRDMWQTFSVTDATIDEAVRTVLAGTGWTIGECDVIKRRNAGMMQVSTLEVIQNLCTAFMCEPVFDTIGKKVSFYSQRGEDKGVYFMSGLNLKKLQKKSTSYDYYTRIIPVGQDGLSIADVNDGKNYLENYQYSSKVLTYVWKDESYTDPQALMEDAQLKLNDLSKPEVSYSADVRDLAKQKPEYGVLSYKLGDTVTIIDQETGTREKQRIKKMVEYPQDPEKNTCEIANTVLTFEEMQQKYQAAISIINNTVAGDGRYTGTINVSDILNFEKGLAGSSTIGGIQGDIADMEGDLAGIKLTIGQIDTNFLKAEEADLKYATIENLNVVREDVHDLNADYATFKSATANEFSAHTARIDTVIGDLASYKTTVTDELIAAKGWMAEGAIGNAQISSVDANKLRAGTIDTAQVTIAGSDGKLQIADNTMKISDANRVRVQVGKDASGDYTLAVWDKAGNLIWDALGATDKTIQRKIIRDNVIADDAAIQALKIDFQSFDTVLTDQGVTISGTVVQVGSKTLNVALSEQTQINTSYSEQLASHASKISANEKAIALKVSSQTYEKDKTTMESTLQTVESSVNVMDGQITALVQDVMVLQGDYNGLDSRTAKLELDSDNFAVELSSTKKTVSDNYTSLKQYTDTAKSSAISTAAADATSKADSALSSAKSYADTAVDGVQVGGRNLLRHTASMPIDYTRANGFYSWGGGTPLSATEDGLKLTYNSDAGISIGVNLADTIDISRNESYTLSFMYRGNITNFGRFYFLKKTGSNIWLNDFPDLKISETEWITYEHTFSIGSQYSDIYGILLFYGHSDWGSDCWIEIKKKSLKLERGTKPTDYTVAPEDTQSQIDSTNAVVTTHTTTLSQHDTRITANENAISLKVWSKDVEEAVSAIEVGGRNLILCSKLDTGKYWRASSSDVIYSFDNGYLEVKTSETYTGSARLFFAQNQQETLFPNSHFVENETFTLSADVKAIDGVSTGEGISSIFYRAQIASSGGSYREVAIFIPKDLPSNVWTRLHATCKFGKHDYSGASVNIGIPANSGICVKNIKLEKGNRATDWTPAPEDVDSAISTVDGKFASYSTTTEMQSAIEVAKSEINLAVSETYTTKQEFGALEIGGRNLQLGSEYWDDTAWYQKEQAIVYGNIVQLTTVGFPKCSPILIQKSITYTISIDIRADVGTDTTPTYGIILLDYFDEDYSRVTYEWIRGSFNSEWKRISYTFTVPNNDAIKYLSVGLRNTENIHSVYFRFLKLEKGTKATDWTPAPEDTDAKITSLETWKTEASQKITKDGIIATVGNYYAYQSDLAGAENRITQAESKIEQQAGAIALTVKEQDVTGNYIVGKLNLSSTTAKIAAKNIDLSGYVTVSSLKTAGATTIDGSNITTGTISADRIDAESLMTKKLTATNLTVAGNSKFSGVLDGATGTFAGSLSAASGTFAGTLSGATGSFSGAVTAKTLTAYDNVKVYDSTSGKTHTAISAFYTSEASGVMLGSDSSEVRCASTFWSYGAIESNKWISANSDFRVSSKSISWLNALRGEAAFNVQYAGSSTGFNALARVKATDGAWILGSLQSRSDFYLAYGNETRLDNGPNGTDTEFVFSANGRFAINNGGLYSRDGVNLEDGLYRKPTGSSNVNGNKCAVLKTNVNNSGTYYFTLSGQWGTAGADFTNKTFTATTSDVRLKDNIVDSKINALSVIDQIRIREFDWRESGMHQKIGFVADELELLDSGLSIGGGWDEDGNIDAKGVNEFYLVGYLTKGIQELHTAQLAQADELLTHKSQIEYLLDENAALKKRVKELEKQTA